MAGKPSHISPVQFPQSGTMNLLLKNKHLYARACFGTPLQQTDKSIPLETQVNDLFPQTAPALLEVITAADWQENSPTAMKEVPDETDKKQKKKDFRSRTKDLNLLWLQEMVSTPYPLREKMALFWHGHFATYIGNPYYGQQLLHELRKNALGNFSDLLVAVSKSQPMLQFLNTNQNKKQHPNENFAREVMELFTLGRGHYSEDDIKDAARAFTGWSFDENGDFQFNEKQHDNGEKKFLGRTGNFSGDDILRIILQQKKCAIFVTQKIYRYLVSDEHIDQERVNMLADSFYESNYDIALLLRNIFTADWFYERAVAGAKIKSPIELLVGYQRMIPLQFANSNTLINLQRLLGQYLFNPPNVAGWPGGRYWIDTSSLALRMRLPEALFGSKELNLNPKELPVEMTEMQMVATGEGQRQKPFKIGNASAEWEPYLAHWRGVDKDDLPATLSAYLLQVPVTREQLNDVVSFTDKSSDDAYIKSLTIRLMELPEYQLT